MRDERLVALASRRRKVFRRTEAGMLLQHGPRRLLVGKENKGFTVAITSRAIAQLNLVVVAIAEAAADLELASRVVGDVEIGRPDALTIDEEQHPVVKRAGRLQSGSADMLDGDLSAAHRPSVQCDGLDLRTGAAHDFDRKIEAR